MPAEVHAATGTIQFVVESRRSWLFLGLFVDTPDTTPLADYVKTLAGCPAAVVAMRLATWNGRRWRQGTSRR